MAHTDPRSPAPAFTATARVRVTLDVTLEHPWPRGTPADQIASEASEEAIRVLSSHLPRAIVVHRTPPPEVTLVLAATKRQ